MEEKTIVPRKFDTVLIHNIEYDLYDIPGKEFDSGNGEPKTWWIYFSDRLPGDMLPPHNSEYFEPYQISINRRLWEITFKQTNSSKEKWGSTHFRNSTEVKMLCNGKLIYSFISTGTMDGLSFSMAKAQYLQTTLTEHPFDFFNPKKEQGRRIYWYGLPATVKVRDSESWEISIIPDYAAGLDKEQWWAQYATRTKKINNVKQDNIDDDDDEMEREDFAEYKERNSINWGDALSDQHINWFRK